MPLSEAKVPALDRGFLFGDAIYEVLRVYGGRPWLEDEHFARLARSLERAAHRRRGPVQTAAPACTRRSPPAASRGDRLHPGDARRRPARPRLPGRRRRRWSSSTSQEFRDPYAEARRGRAACVITHPDIRWGRCDIKSTNLLGNVLAMQAAKEAGCLEALLYLPDGTLTEGTHTSFFGVRRRRVLTAAEQPTTSCPA